MFGWRVLQIMADHVEATDTRAPTALLPPGPTLGIRG
jgi:hypothetical protein